MHEGVQIWVHNYTRKAQSERILVYIVADIEMHLTKPIFEGVKFTGIQLVQEIVQQETFVITEIEFII